MLLISIISIFQTDEKPPSTESGEQIANDDGLNTRSRPHTSSMGSGNEKIECEHCEKTFVRGGAYAVCTMHFLVTHTAS